MLEFDDLYEILQVHPSAHPDVVQASHRQLSRLYDPSRYPYSNASEMMEAINYAYRVLSDPGKRAVYDQYRKTLSQVPDVVKAKSFQVLDDAGNVRAELGCRAMTFGDGSDTEPILELKDSEGHVRFSMQLDYFDQPRLVMGDEEEHDDRFRVSMDSSGKPRLEMRDGSLVVRDAEDTIRLEAGLGGGDEGDSPRMIMRDNSGRTRLEIELVEVELDQMLAKVGDDYELSPWTLAYPPRLRMRDEEGSIRLEIGLFGAEVANSPMLRLLDDQERLRLEIGHIDESPWVTMKGKDGIDRLQVELVEVEIDGNQDYIPQLRVLDQDENIRFETNFPPSQTRLFDWNQST